MKSLFESWRKFMAEITKPYLEPTDSMEQNADMITQQTGIKVVVAEPRSRLNPYGKNPVYVVLDPEQGNKTGYKEETFDAAYRNAWYLGKKLGTIPEG